MKKFYVLFTLMSFGVFAQVGTTCNDPIIIGSLPYTTTDNTGNYADNFNPPTSIPVSCGASTSGNFYLSGNDVVYSFTPTVNSIVKIEIPDAVAWTGLFVFANCSDIGSAPYGCNCSSSAGNRTVDNLSVNAGQTYYIVISSWEAPQTIPYTLNITLISLGIDTYNLNNSISLYPNPTNGELFFETSFEITKAIIYNVNGQLIESKDVASNKIEVSQLAEGIYFVELENKEGLKSKHKFIKN